MRTGYKVWREKRNDQDAISVERSPALLQQNDKKSSGESAMKTIWKFDLQPNKIQTISLPVGAEILTVQAKIDNTPMLWVLVDPDMPPEERQIGIYTTNTALPDDPGRYCGTFLLYDGTLEFHLFAM